MAFYTWNKAKDFPPDILKPCFLYLACYLIDYEIPAKYLTELWIAEQIITPEDGETREETAYKYLEQLAQRSLVCVSKRSFSGTITYCRVHQSIHEFAIKRGRKLGVLAFMSDSQGEVDHVAMHRDNERCNMVLSSDMQIVSILAFDFIGILS
ncbi:putative disease resistance RPP8-like protein 2 [Carex rostrata]